VRDRRGETKFLLGCAWAAMIAVVVLTLAFLWVLWRLGFIGNLD